jgi:predicted ATP-binding protein involved in virulence
MSNIAIKEVRVEALHEQYDVAIELQPDLNVIYGKNGRGKTTLLHILANALELDFDRFKHIQFRSIEISTYQGGSLKILSQNKDLDRQMLIEVDGQRLSPLGEGAGLSEAETNLIRSTLGSRAVYLPAFRAILERSPGDSYVDRERQDEMDAIRTSEIQIARDGRTRVASYESRTRSEQHRLTATKTLQCRHWFGQFVPIIRYPSLIDVRSRLLEELRTATFEVSVFEQRLFSQLFIQVFKAISAESVTPDTGDTESLLTQVQGALAAIDEASGGASNVYGEIRDAVDEARKSRVTEEKTTSRILGLYARLLEERAVQHKQSFSKIRDFEKSINLFLDGKTFVLDELSLDRPGRGASVISTNGRHMNLSALSSGERQVVTMIFCASRLAENRGIFLVDEPELSLHVDWQRSILGEVMRQAEGRQVIACTHSPEVGADHYSSVQDFNPQPSMTPHDLFSTFDTQEDL